MTMTIFGRASVPTELSADERSAAADKLGPCGACMGQHNPRHVIAVRDVGSVAACVNPVACREAAQRYGVYANPVAIRAVLAGRTRP